MNVKGEGLERLGPTGTGREGTDRGIVSEPDTNLQRKVTPVTTGGSETTVTV